MTDILSQTFSMRMGSVATMNGTAGINAIAIGSAQTAIANGGSTNATIASGNNAIAIGSSATAGGTGAIAFGLGAVAGQDGSVALGANSLTAAAVSTAGTTINGASYSFAGGSAGSTVSVGAAGAERTVTNLAAGRVSGTSTDAVNGSQLFVTNQSVEALGDGLTDVASAFGGGAAYDAATGVFTGPSYTVGNGAGGTTTVTGVNGAITNFDLRTTSNETAITNLTDAITGGTIGLVLQANSTADITIANFSGGTVVDFTGMDGERTLTGVAEGDISAISTDAINGSQLHASNQSIASALGGGTGLNPDGTLTTPQYSLSGTTYNDVGSAFGALQGQIDTIQGVAMNSGVSANTAQPNALATGSETVALGGGSSASGSNATAIGSGSSAGHANATAIGAGVATTRDNQVAIGTDQNTYTLAGINSAASSAAQTGQVQVVTSDADGNLATADISSFMPDLGGLNGRLDKVDRQLNRHADGIAIAMAMGGTYLPPNKKSAISGNIGFFEGNSALSFSGAARVDESWTLNGGVGVGFQTGTPAGRVGATFSW